ncbi:MAG: ABC transporter permease subunit, partial [Rhizobiales bacterium]|nr:ABC transporter permease subunit [Hyphomicrobiales bacterium]
MISYTLKRIAMAVPTLVGVSLVTFLLLRLVPGGPVQAVLGVASTNPAAVAAVTKEMGLDRPLYEQYFIWLGKALSGDFGMSTQFRVPVAALILPKLQNTLILTTGSLVYAVVLGILIGVVTAIYHRSLLDRALMLVTLVGASAPVFWVGLLLIYLFAIKLNWLPAMGMSSIAGNSGPFGVLRYLILPAFANSIIAMAVIARIVRSSMLEVLTQPYVLAARARGLSRYRQVVVHAFRNVARRRLPHVFHHPVARLRHPAGGDPARLGGLRAGQPDSRRRPHGPRPAGGARMTTMLPAVATEGMRSEERIPLSAFQQGRAAFLADRMAVAGLAILVLAVLASIFAPWLTSYDPNIGDTDAYLVPPFSPGHIFGTDNQGRDILARILYGGQLVFPEAVIPVVVASILGMALGLIGGFFRGVFGEIVMRTLDVLFASPMVLLAIAIAATLGSGPPTVIVSMAVVITPYVARVVATTTAQLRNAPFVDAARCAGFSRWKILRREILPH